MTKKLFTIVFAGTVFTMAFLPAVSMAGKGRMGGQGLRNQTNCTLHTPDRQQLRDGSCLKSGASATGIVQKKGNTYGPGDGTGNQGAGPKDGTGYGTSSKK
jgi:hypothetical protein